MLINRIQHYHCYSYLASQVNKSFSKTKTIRRFFSFNSSKNQNCSVAIIGSGPAGFYTAQQLLKNPNISVDIYEKFPVPFGLVRFGVAPDHQEVKNVVNSFTKVALNDRTKFIGNVDIGKDVKLDELREAYHAVVLSHGSSEDAMLNIPGEDLSNVISAKRFVGWYNGIPQDKDLDISLKTETAIIIGQGNVAIDCARILLTPIDVLKTTDITSHALKELLKSQIRKVILVGRRGPLQTAFKIKEFRELTKLEDCQVKFEWPENIEKNSNITPELLETLPRSRKRLFELFKKIIDDSNLNKSCSKQCIFKFCLSSQEIYASHNQNSVSGVRFQENILDDAISEQAKISKISTKTIDIGSGLVIRAIGYRSTPIDQSLPFDYKRGIILNHHGRVNNTVGLYCSGWAAFGATGVIVNTMNASFEVAKNIINDFETGVLTSDDKPREAYQSIGKLLLQRNAKVIDFVDWQKIDRYERELGHQSGKPREKFVSVEEILDLKEKK